MVDGGKGQLSAAVEALDDMGLRGTIAVVGIAKRLEEIYFPGDTVPLTSIRTPKHCAWCSTCATKPTASA